jgi:uncharacterized membrane protein
MLKPTPIGRRETLQAATIGIVLSALALLLVTLLDSGIRIAHVSLSSVGVAFLLVVSYYLSAFFFGNMIVKDVLRHGDSIFGSTIVWSLINTIASVATTVIVCFCIGLIVGYQELEFESLFQNLWWAEFMAGILSIPAIIGASVYYTRLLKKIKAAQKN